MTNQIRESSPTRPNGKPDKAAPSFVKTELGDEELSQVSAGKSSSIALACASGKHVGTSKIVV
jgi:hypothetical protein